MTNKLSMNGPESHASEDAHRFISKHFYISRQGRVLCVFDSDHRAVNTSCARQI